MTRAVFDVEGVTVRESVTEGADGKWTLVWEADGVTVTQEMPHFSNTMVDLARTRARAELLGGT